MTGSDMAELDVLIPTCGRPVELATTLAGLAAQDVRPHELAAVECWEGCPRPERIEPGTRAWDRWTLHNPANPLHRTARHVRAGERRVPYRISRVGGCVLYDRTVLDAAGGFEFWCELPAAHAGEDVLAQHRVIARAGGAGILPSGAYHLESPTTLADRRANARSAMGVR